MTRTLSALLFLLLPLHLLAQDTIAVYFPNGSARILPEQGARLNMLRSRYELASVERVELIGVADSTGNAGANLRLSHKRAAAVQEYCVGLFPPETAFESRAIGEQSQPGPLWKSRRVDLVLHFRAGVISAPESAAYGAPGSPELPSSAVPGSAAFTHLSDTLPDTLPRQCYEVAYNLLHRAHLRAVRYNKQPMIALEVQKNTLTEFPALYAGTFQQGKFVPYPLKWRTRSVSLHKRTRMVAVANIPAWDYERFKVFTQSDLPCTECAEGFADSLPILQEQTCLQQDRMLMSMAEYRWTGRNDRNGWVRAPREFVDPNSTYYIGCPGNAVGIRRLSLHVYLLAPISDTLQLDWVSRQGKKHNKYLYARVPVNSGRVYPLLRKMECCLRDVEESECQSKMIFQNNVPCGNFGGYVGMLFAEAGAIAWQDQIQGFAGLGIQSGYDIINGAVSAGYITGNGIYGNLKAWAPLWMRNETLLNPFRGWVPWEGTRMSKWDAGLYAGAEIRTMYGISDTRWSPLQPHLFFGIQRMRYLDSRQLFRLSLQYGPAIQVTDVPLRIYGVLQAGASIEFTNVLGKLSHQNPPPLIRRWLRQGRFQ